MVGGVDVGQLVGEGRDKVVSVGTAGGERLAKRAQFGKIGTTSVLMRHE